MGEGALRRHRRFLRSERERWSVGGPTSVAGRRGRPSPRPRAGASRPRSAGRATRHGDDRVPLLCNLVRCGARAGRAGPADPHEGIVHDTSRASGATARAVTQSDSKGSCSRASGARPRRPRRREPSSSISATTSLKKAVRRSIGSTRATGDRSVPAQGEYPADPRPSRRRSRPPPRGPDHAPRCSAGAGPRSAPPRAVPAARAQPVRRQQVGVALRLLEFAGRRATRRRDAGRPAAAPEGSSGEDDDAALRLLALALAVHAVHRSHGIVDDLALERASSARAARPGRTPGPRRGTSARVRVSSAAPRGADAPPMSSISRLRTPVCCWTARRVSSCSASSVVAVLADQDLEPIADDRHDRAVALDVQVEVAVEVEDVEQSLEVVGRDTRPPAPVRHRVVHRCGVGAGASASAPLRRWARRCGLPGTATPVSAVSGLLSCGDRALRRGRQRRALVRSGVRRSWGVPRMLAGCVGAGRRDRSATTHLDGCRPHRSASSRVRDGSRGACALGRLDVSGRRHRAHSTRSRWCRRAVSTGRPRCRPRRRRRHPRHRTADRRRAACRWVSRAGAAAPGSGGLPLEQARETTAAGGGRYRSRSPRPVDHQRRHALDDEVLLPHAPEVRGQPVQEHGDREAEAEHRRKIGDT